MGLIEICSLSVSFEEGEEDGGMVISQIIILPSSPAEASIPKSVESVEPVDSADGQGADQEREKIEREWAAVCKISLNVESGCVPLWLQ